MAAIKENSAHFPIFILTVMALALVPYTIVQLFRATTRKATTRNCQCSLCFRSGKYRDRIWNLSSTCRNLTLVMLWAIMAVVVYYIKHSSREVKSYVAIYDVVRRSKCLSHSNILGLQHGASRLEIKKAYRRLSIQYHPNNNPDPEAYKYFVEYISKAYQALTDPVSRKNFKEYGHPDGWQGFQMGIAFPSFLLDIDGASGGVLLLGTVGVCIILPLMIVAFYLLRSAKYTENDVMQPKVYYLKTSLAPVKGMSILIKGVEHNFTPIRRTDKEHLQKLFVLVRRELNLGLKNVMQQHAMFWNQNPALVKNELLIQAQLTRQTAALSPSLQRHLRCILKIMPHLFEDLYKMAGTPKSLHDHGSLRNIIEAVEFSQSIIQAVPLSARKVSGNEGYATFLQLPHFSESIFKKIARKKICIFRDFREMTQEDRIKLLTQVAGLSDSEAQDVEIVLEMMPSISVDINKCELEGDIVTIPVWVAVKRENDIIGVHAHAPYFPFHKKENFWLLLVDASKNLLMWQKVSFMDEGTAITTASKAIRELNMGHGASEEEVNAAVKVAVEKVKSGSRLVVNKLRVLSDGNIKLELICLCDSWIGCDKGYEIELKDLKRSSRTRTRDGASADEMPALEEEDYLSGCSEDDKM